MNVIELNEGRKVEYELRGTKLDFADGTLTMNLAKYQRDYPVTKTITGDAEGIKSALTQYASLGANGLDQMKVTTLQQNLDSLIPGLAAVALTLFVCKLLKKNVSPIVIILALFGVGIVGRLIGLL